MRSDDRDSSFYRLHRLVGRGYKAKLGDLYWTDTIILEHPNDGQPLYLYEDATIFASYYLHSANNLLTEKVELRIKPEDREEFVRFLAGIPSPSILIRWKELIAVIILFGSLAIAISLCIAFGEFVISSIFRNA